MNNDLEGYELAHGQESFGDKFFGLKIFVKMSDRKLRDEDRTVLYRAADAIRKGLETVSAQVDPEGPKLRQRYRDEIVNIYKQAGVPTVIFLEELPNGYCSDSCCLNRPWFRVTSPIGHVVIGWRKSVIEIDWSGTIVKASGEDLFPADRVTKKAHGIHAWGVDAATAYIKRLHEASALAVPVATQ